MTSLSPRTDKQQDKYPQFPDATISPILKIDSRYNRIQTIPVEPLGAEARRPLPRAAFLVLNQGLAASP